jgi:O-antigen/teichoic acid export membrane protein
MPMGPDELGEFDTELAPIPQLLTTRRALLSRGRRAIGIITSFFLGQGALQGVQVLAGLFLVRKLSIDAYAQFGLAFGFQATMSTLMDLGFSSTIIPLVGERRDDRALVGRYVRSAKHLRDLTFWILAPFAVTAILAIMYKHHWSWSLQLLLLSSVLLTLYSSGRVSYSSAPLFLFGRLRDFYLPQTLSGLVRVAAYGVLRLAGSLNAWTAAWLNALNVTVNGSLLGKKSRQYVEWPSSDDPSTDREMFRYILPATPAIIFSAFQSQISLFLISIFGQTTNIAEVAALGRLGQLFSVLMTFNVVVVEPYIARVSRQRLPPIYFGFLALAAVLCAPVVLFAFDAPAPFLWLLGSKYENLGGTVGWVVLAACINYLAGLIWIMNRARRWLFWHGTILEVVLVLAVQIAYVVFVGVHTTQEAVLFTFASSFCYVAAHSYIGIYGFLKGPRTVSTTYAGGNS